MTIKNQYRPEVIDNDTFEVLKDYLLFRHFIRHLYKWRLNWDEFKHISLDAEDSWNKTKAKLIEFISE